jgi:hypothetical protein
LSQKKPSRDKRQAHAADKGDGSRPHSPVRDARLLPAGRPTARRRTVPVTTDRAVDREKNEHLENALTSNRKIGAAMGILMANHKLTEQQAFDALRIASQHSHKKLHDIAFDVVETGHLELPWRRATQT